MGTQLDHFNCRILQALMEDGFDLQTVLGKLKDKVPENAGTLTRLDIKDLTSAVTSLAARMHAKALRWSMSGVAGRSFNLRVRIATVNFIVAAAEYGNQFQAKADAIQKQIDIGEKEEFPLSVVLKDTKPTDFLYLYDLMDASPDQVGFLIGGAWPFGADVDDRIKMAQRLFADHNWAKINTVHASGWGDVRMAFIKDDVGNWNLKSFDNRPGELLKAYGDVAGKALKAAAKAAAAGATGGGSAQVDVLLKLADQTAFSAPATSTADVRLNDELDGLRQRTLQKLLQTAAEHAKNEQTLVEKYEAESRKLADTKKEAVGYDGQKAATLQAGKDLIGERGKARKKFSDILQEHSELVDVLAKSLVKK